jgi:hypothetical protein
MKKYFLLLVSLIALSADAFAEGRFSIVGGVNYGLDSTSTPDGIGGTITVKSGMGFGGGLLMNLHPVEIGAIYASKTYTAEFLGTSTSTSVTGIHIPVMYRFRGLTSFGVGGFYDIPITSGGTSNYGLTAGPRFGMTNGFFVDLRFNYGLKTGNSKDVLALVGYSFGK